MNKSIVLTVCEELNVTPENFFGPRRKKQLTHARRVAIQRLHDAGFSYMAVARLIRRNYSTVQYWIHADYREQRSRYAAEYHAKPRARKLAQEQRQHVLEIYQSQGMQAAKPIAISYGMNPALISHYARKIGIKGRPGRPMEARA